MEFIDGFRAQYYLRKLLEGKVELERKLAKLKTIWPTIEIEMITENICEQLAHQLDQAILPTIVHEIVKAGKLLGKTPEERYQNFFLENNSWTERARKVPDKYPFLFEILGIITQSTLKNIDTMLARLVKDYVQIKKHLLSQQPGKLTSIKFGISDRHTGGQQTTILSFESGENLIYKPVDLTPNLLLTEFVEFLDLPNPFDLKNPKVLNKEGYGWVEFVSPHPCKSLEEVSNFYRRAGALLAIADALNYCDGHMENLIASGGYPILIDPETLFHVFGEVDPSLGERSVLFTGLVEKPPENEEDKGFTAAFQAPSINRYELLSPYAKHDHTDKIEVRYRGFAPAGTSNSPIFNKTVQTPLRFIDEFVQGFQFVYRQITIKAQAWLKNKRWWDAVGKVKARQLIRHTLYYELLLRRMQHPETGGSKELAINSSFDLLYSEYPELQIITEYEIKSLLKADIPFFYHFPNSPNLYDGNGKCYPNYFKKEAKQELQALFKSRSEKYLQRNIKILKNILTASPEPIPL